MDLLAPPGAAAPGRPATTALRRVAATRAALARVERHRPVRVIARLWPLWAAAGAGLTLWLAFPPYDQWWLGPLGVALLALATYRRGFWAGAGLGAVTGLGLLIPLLWWAGGYIGAVWLFLPVGESAYFALLGGLCALATRAFAPRYGRAARGATSVRWRWTWPLATTTLWVLQEALRDRTPFGGFPWGRLAFSQADSPLLGLAALGGAPLVTAAVALIGGLVALAVRLLLEAPRPFAWSRLRPAVLALVVALVALIAPAPILWGGTPAAAGEQTVRVAVVQGNVPRLGLDFNAQRRAVLNNHVAATAALAQRVDAGLTPRPDLVVWPENSSDIDPVLNADAAAVITQVAQAIGAPILVGGLRDGPTDTEVRNVGLVWDPQAGGPTQMYVKRHPVPFAEYVPMRAFIRTFITDKVDLVQRDFVAGDRPGVLTLGPATVGDVICFEVAYDGVVRDTVTGGAQLLVVQTNNATFNAAEARQQLAMVRLRAVEHGREALMASTVGVSAFVDAHGRVYDATRFDAEAVIERTVTLSTGRTMATRLGVLPEVLLAAFGVGFVLLAIVLPNLGRRTGRRRTDVGDGAGVVAEARGRR
ncbi:MAG TPA: apolipoprotein N-acyltransferase [Micromonosporaceae bacterium]